MNKTLFAAAAGAALAAAGCASTDRAGSDRTDTVDGRLYVGAGGLISRLKPDTDDAQGIDVDDSGSGGANVLLGYDINDRFSLEGNYARLGEATLAPDGRIEYDVAGISALAYAFSGPVKRARREGLSGYGRLGVGRLENDSDVAYERVNDFNVLIGLGAEYGFVNGLGVRGELVAHDEDVAYAQLALVYRIGRHEPRRRGPGASTPAADVPAVPAATASPAPRTSIADRAPVALPEAAPATGPSLRPGAEPVDGAGKGLAGEFVNDGDRDGIEDAVDDCIDTAVGLPVDAAGCTLYDGAVDGVEFELGRDALTAGARRVLDGVAATLSEYPVTRIAIEAHTDNTGTAGNNLQLSRRRAVAVASYLVSRGVAGERLVPRAFGESRPSVPNDSAENLAINRRVELRFLP